MVRKEGERKEMGMPARISTVKSVFVNMADIV